MPGVLAALLVALAMLLRSGILSRFLLPAAALLVAVAVKPMLSRNRPEEPWLGKLLIAGVSVKLLASLLRYFTVFHGYGGVGDSQIYHDHGAEYVAGIAEPLADLRKTNFVKHFTGLVYTVFGVDLVMGFFVFGLLAFVGSFLWYRATAMAVPSVNRRLYCMLVFFAPSIAFWPSSIGKESLMQLGLGAAALGTALMLGGRVLRGFIVAVPGGWLMWVVRPHLLAFVALSGAAAYVIGRGRQRSPTNISLMRPIGLVIVSFVLVFALTEAMSFLGMEELSISSIEEELNEQTGRTSQGGSRIDSSGSFQLTPLSLPIGAVTVLLRPFVWEVDSAFQLIASLETAFVTFLLIRRWRSIALSLRLSRSEPFLFYCWTLVGLYAIAFSAFANMGLLVRQRSLVLPALFVILAVEAKDRAAAASRDAAAGGSVAAP